MTSFQQKESVFSVQLDSLASAYIIAAAAAAMMMMVSKRECMIDNRERLLSRFYLIYFSTL